LVGIAPLRIGPLPPAGLRIGEGPQRKGWFHKEPDQIQDALPFGKRARKGAEKMNTYEIVTERIINLLEHEVILWRRPWAATGLPRNLVSKKPYRGVNAFLRFLGPTC
jgi:hypothetical protein